MSASIENAIRRAGKKISDPLPDILQALQEQLPARSPQPTDMLGFDGWLVGTRFEMDFDMTDEEMPPKKHCGRAGVGPSMVYDMPSEYDARLVLLVEPSSGPIYRRAMWQNTEGEKPDYWCAQCVGCGASSKDYKQRNSQFLFRWAHNHRCGKLDQSYIRQVERYIQWVRSGRPGMFR